VSTKSAWRIFWGSGSSGLGEKQEHFIGAIYSVTKPGPSTMNTETNTMADRAGNLRVWRTVKGILLIRSFILVGEIGLDMGWSENENEIPRVEN
jgi:hypothetical protein